MGSHRKTAGSTVLIGTSSFSEKDWVGPLYPEGTAPRDFLRLYAQRFPTVEIDATYYAVPSTRTVRGWAERTPEDFVVAAKFPRAIVHAGQGPTPDPARILTPEATYGVRDSFLEAMSELGPRLGPLVLQFPYFSRKVFGSPAEFLERLDRFLGDLPEGFQYAVEIRNRSWLKPGFAEMLRSHGVALVLVDHAWMPHGADLIQQFDPVTASFTYIRLLGDRKEIEAITKHWDREVIDRGESLRRWAEVLTLLGERGIKVLVYINNHYAGYAPATAERLEALLRQR